MSIRLAFNPSHVSERVMPFAQVSDLEVGLEACGLAVGRRPQRGAPSLKTWSGGMVMRRTYRQLF